MSPVDATAEATIETASFLTRPGQGPANTKMGKKPPRSPAGADATGLVGSDCAAPQRTPKRKQRDPANDAGVAKPKRTESAPVTTEVGADGAAPQNEHKRRRRDQVSDSGDVTPTATPKKGGGRGGGGAKQKRADSAPVATDDATDVATEGADDGVVRS